MTEKSYPELFAQVEENYKVITDNIAEAAIRSGRRYEDITFLAATKTVDVEVINHAISLGLDHIGENRVQELLDKYDNYNLEKCDLQFIGQLQKNKIKYIIDKVSQIQSADSMSQISEISKLAVKHDKVMNILIEVNIGREENKGGVNPDALMEFIDEAREYKGIHINGLMAIPPICEGKELSKYFCDMKQYYVDIKSKNIDNISMSVLSMGMSSDYAQAIECGANMVRIGSSLFGKRIYK
ncbi:MAG: YggS family pyridoxal phosphate-dependent enzyme [Clostridia bacterium]|nr:YggS family pyridoxal phosphate-dependent enzyme [Clostridia bacterium]